ncbi:MAG: helix-turn-helix domain-containing protein [Adlercreutzia sp.]
MKESRTVEFKRGMTKSFLKTVSAFANYGGGDIFFGVDDEGLPLASPRFEPCASISRTPSTTIYLQRQLTCWRSQLKMASALLSSM